MAVIIIHRTRVDLTTHRGDASDVAFEPRVAHAGRDGGAGHSTSAVAVVRTRKTQRRAFSSPSLVRVGRALADVGSRAVVTCSSGTVLQYVGSAHAVSVIRAGRARCGSAGVTLVRCGGAAHA